MNSRISSSGRLAVVAMLTVLSTSTALAQAKKKSVAQIIKNAVRKAVSEDSTDFEEQAEIIKQNIKFCSDKEVLELANLRMPDNEHLDYLFAKNRESVLTKKEQAELTKAVELSSINDLRKRSD